MGNSEDGKCYKLRVFKNLSLVIIRTQVFYYCFLLAFAIPTTAVRMKKRRV